MKNQGQFTPDELKHQKEIEKSATRIQSSRNKESIYKISRRYFHDANKPGLEGFRQPKTSWSLVSWVVEYSSLPHTEKLVAAHIASYYNLENQYAHPTYATLNEDSGISKATIAKAVQRMVESGEWRVWERTNPETGKVGFCYAPLTPKPEDKRDGKKWKSWSRTKNYNAFLESKNQTKEKRRATWKNNNSLKNSGTTKPQSS